MTPPDHLLLGPERHGVTRYAAQVAEAVGAVTVRDPAGRPRLHVHLTDGLLGDLGVEVIEATATTVTLHDVPQPTDGAARFARRAEVYRRVVEAARGVVCNSEHERDALLALGARPSSPVRVVPLPVVPVPLPARWDEDDPVVALLGFVYPGKGHAEALWAVAEVGRGARVVALGDVADGHDRDVADLHDLARDLGVGFEVTGHLDDAELVRRAVGVTVPVAAHRNVSASGSINSWLAARRRPLVLASRYTCEMAALRPGTTTV
ncbi:hypothetical protein, partial [Solicola sp. PLA-1-18]|uniref:hypothetical protein n=1 Tax=Solicola sp. PLA-1-18 TaxID=3380532 RepID=UPI003B7B9375